MKDDAIQERSPALTFVGTLWHGRMEATLFSWARLNWAMSKSIDAAIEGGLRFDEGDFIHFAKHFSSGYYAGVTTNDGLGEHWYTLAAKVGNTSACRAYEKWRKRKPFIFQGRRLVCHSNLTWDGIECGVTSFAQDGSKIILAHYDSRYISDPYDYHGRGKPSRIFKVSWKELRAANRELTRQKIEAKEAGDE